MLTSTPIITPNINYYYSSTAVPPQQQYQDHYQHQHNLKGSPHVPPTTSTTGENILLVYQNSEYIPQPQLHHSSNYESGNVNSFTSRSNSSSIMTLSKNSQVRLPPISSLVPSTAYVAHPDQLPSSASHSAMLMNDSTQSSPNSSAFFQQQQNYHHSHSHSHNHNHNYNHLLHQPKSAPQMVPMTYMMDNTSSSSLPIRLDPAMAAQMELANLSRSSSNSIPSDVVDTPSALPLSNALNPAIRLRKQCPVCGKICSRPSTLKTHYLIHTGDTPFKCTWDNCKKSFNVKSNMLRHLKSHERKLVKKEGCKPPV